MRLNAEHSAHNDIARRRHWIAVARGDEPPDLVLKGGQVVSVFTGEVLRADVALVDGHVAGLGHYDGPKSIDVQGGLVTPGFMDGHCHIESSKLSVPEFARVVLRSGTTAVVVDPHELANVLGVEGIEYVLGASEDVGIDVYVMLPSCVPASQYESPRSAIKASDYATLLDHPRVIGLAEMMNYPAVIRGESDALEKLCAAGWSHIDGHAPLVSGRRLNAYLTAGPATDHESTSLEEALEKRRLGMWVMIREASMIRNLRDLIPLVKQHGTDNTLFVTDDREADTLLHEGHVNAMVRLAVQEGVAVADAVKLSTINVARCHSLPHVGAVAPGYRADICVFPDAVSFEPALVLKDGRVVVEHGRTVFSKGLDPVPPGVRNTVRCAALSAGLLQISAPSGQLPHIRVIELVPDQVVTRVTVVPASVDGGQIIADPDRDLAKLAVIERHRATGNIGFGFVRGFGMQRGAFASTIAHDAHNLIVVGVDDGDMLRAAEHLAAIGGGLSVALGGEIMDELPLPIAGLMSNQPAEEVDRALRRLEHTLRSLGVNLPTPFMYLGFLALSVIPELRVTDQGVVDVTRFELVPLTVQP